MLGVWLAKESLGLVKEGREKERKGRSTSWCLMVMWSEKERTQAQARCFFLILFYVSFLFMFIVLGKLFYSKKTPLMILVKLGFEGGWPVFLLYFLDVSLLYFPFLMFFFYVPFLWCSHNVDCLHLTSIICPGVLYEVCSLWQIA